MAYNTLERRVKLSKKMLLHRKILIVSADNFRLIIRKDVIQFEHILCFSKIEGSIIP